MQTLPTSRFATLQALIKPLLSGYRSLHLRQIICWTGPRFAETKLKLLKQKQVQGTSTSSGSFDWSSGRDVYIKPRAVVYRKRATFDTVCFHLKVEAWWTRLSKTTAAQRQHIPNKKFIAENEMTCHTLKVLCAQCWLLRKLSWCVVTVRHCITSSVMSNSQRHFVT